VGLFGPSITNIAYYTQLLKTLVLLPLASYSDTRVTVKSVTVIIANLVAGYAGRTLQLNRLGDRTSAFNLAAVFAVLFAFVVFNVQEALGGIGAPGLQPAQRPRLAAQAAGSPRWSRVSRPRYIGAQFSGEPRISAMRRA
jgi:hypothetical protein